MRCRNTPKITKQTTSSRRSQITARPLPKRPRGRRAGIIAAAMLAGASLGPRTAHAKDYEIIRKPKETYAEVSLKDPNPANSTAIHPKFFPLLNHVLSEYKRSTLTISGEGKELHITSPYIVMRAFERACRGKTTEAEVRNVLRKEIEYEKNLCGAAGELCLRFAAPFGEMLAEMEWRLTAKKNPTEADVEFAKWVAITEMARGKGN